MRNYEGVFIFSPELSEVQLKEEIKKLENMIQALGAQDLRVDRWSKRELQCLLGKQNYGTYIFVNFAVEQAQAAIDQITSACRINDSLLKFQIHRVLQKTRKFKGIIRKRSSDGGSGDDFSDSSEGEFLTV